MSERDAENDAGLPEAVDRASAVFGWQHLVRYSGMSAEWMDATLTAIVRAARVTSPGTTDLRAALDGADQ